MHDAPRTVIDYYNDTAASWAEKWYADDSMLPLLTRFMALPPSNPRVLDLCCGAGYETMRLARLGAQAEGLDLSRESLRIAREHNPSIPFHAGDMLADYSHLGRFDGLVCIAGLVHLTDTQLPLAFRRMANVLKPDTPVLLVVRDGEGRLSRHSDVEVDGIRYDRAFFAHTLKALQRASSGLFRFEAHWPHEEPSPWRNYLFRGI